MTFIYNVTGCGLRFYSHRLLPFGDGKRVCPGEKFATSRLFLLLVSLYQRLEFELCDPDINYDVRSYDNGMALEVSRDVLVKVQRRC